LPDNKRALATLQEKLRSYLHSKAPRSNTKLSEMERPAGVLIYDKSSIKSTLMQGADGAGHPASV
jgi:hypothetical protein